MNRRQAALLPLFGLSGCVLRKRAPSGNFLSIAAPWEIRGKDLAGIIGLMRVGVGEALTGVTAGGAVVGGLAEHWRLDPDRLTWRFFLRRGVRFHDGSPLTAGRAVSVLNRYRKQSALRDVPIASMGADNDATVAIRTTKPFSPLPAFFCSTPILDLSYDSFRSTLRAIGTGPYRFTGTEGPTQLDLCAFPSYWGAPAGIANIRYWAVTSAETRAWMAQSEEIDVVYTLASIAADRLRRMRGAKLFSTRVMRIRMLKFNCGSPFFQDVRVRRAIGLALDRPGIAEGILHDPSSAASQLFPPELSSWHQSDFSSAHRPETARQLLAEAGWKPGPDKILFRDGTPFRVELRTYSSRPDLPEIATAIQAQLRAIGIRVDVAITEASALADGHRDGDLQMALLARSVGMVPDPIATITSDFTGAGGEFGAMQWNSPEVDAAASRYVNSFDEEERRPLRRRIVEILQEQAPVLPLAWYEDHVAISSRISGFVPDPHELHYSPQLLQWAR